MAEKGSHDSGEFRPRPADSEEIRMEPAHSGSSPHIFDFFDPHQDAVKEPALTGQLNEASDLSDAPLHAVGDEPALKGIAVAPGAMRGFADFYEERRAASTFAGRWGVILLLALISGPLAIPATMLETMLETITKMANPFVSLLYICAFGPLIEEMLKIGGILYLAEKKPWLIPNRMGPVVVAIGAGLGFAIIENLMYLYVYIPDASEELIYWRWTVCVGLHVSCSVIASLGISRIWMHSHDRGTLPSLALASPFLAAAVILHGGYNTLAIVLEWSGVLQF